MVLTEMRTPTDRRPEVASLADRKMHLAEQFSCRALFVELEQADAAFVRALGAKLDAEARIARGKAELEDLATLAGLAVEGKNEIERRANRVKALNQDAAYRDAVKTQRAAESEAARIEADLETARRTARRLELNIRYRTAVLEVLAD